MSADEKSDKALFGAAGEHYAMSQLLRQDMMAALTPGRAPNADILVSDRESGRFAAVQVKTCRNALGWRMSGRHQTPRPLLFYGFVSFYDDCRIRSWILPSNIVAKALRRSYDNWLSRRGKNNSEHKENELRWIRTRYRYLPRYPEGWMDKFEDAWKSVCGPSPN